MNRRPFDRVIRVLPVLAVTAAWSACARSGAEENGWYYPAPGDAWEYRAPNEVGMSAELVQAAVEYAKAHDSEVVPYDYSGHEEKFGKLEGPLPEERGGPAGLVLRHGYIVAEWGDTKRVDLTFSVTKSFVSTMVGLALDRGMIDDVQDPIGKYVTDGKFDSPHNSQITWDILLQQRSEWEGTLFGKSDTADFYHRRDRTLPRQAPGTHYEYNDVRVNLASYSALQVWRRGLPEVLKELVMDRVGATDSWVWHGYRTSNVEIDGQTINSVAGGGHWGGGLWISARDMARFGYLFLRNGAWDGEQLISSDWIDLAMTPSPISPNYGYMWWLTPGTPGDDVETGTPVPTFAARGYGSNVIWVNKEHDLVVVLRWFGGNPREVYGPLVAAVDGAG